MFFMDQEIKPVEGCLTSKSTSFLTKYIKEIHYLYNLFITQAACLQQKN